MNKLKRLRYNFALVVTVFLFFLAGASLGAEPLGNLDLNYSSEDWDHIKRNCQEESDLDSFMYSSFKDPLKSKEDVLRKYKETYNSESRLKHRAYYNKEENKFYLPWVRDTSLPQSSI